MLADELMQTIQVRLFRCQRGYPILCFKCCFTCFDSSSFTEDLEYLPAIGEFKVVVEHGGRSKGSNLNTTVSLIYSGERRGENRLEE